MGAAKFCDRRGHPERENVDAAVGLAVVAQRAGDPAGGVFGVPGLHPRADALFEIGDDLRGDAGVNVLTFCLFCVLHWCFLHKKFFLSEIPRNGGRVLEPSGPVKGGGASRSSSQTLDGEHGSGKRPEKARGMKEEEKKRLEDDADENNDQGQKRPLKEVVLALPEAGRGQRCWDVGMSALRKCVGTR